MNAQNSAAEEAAPALVKAWKVTIEGNYRNHSKELVEFSDLVGFVPFVKDEIADMHVIDRYAAIWIRAEKDEKGNKKYPDGIENVRQVFVINKEEVEYDFSYIGKSIRDMNFEELQDLATAKDLRTIPAEKDAGLMETRTRAYKQYSDDILGNAPIKIEDVLRNWATIPAIRPDAVTRADEALRLSNEQMIGMEQDVKDLKSTPKSSLSMNDLVAIGLRQGKSIHPSMSFDDAYQMLMGN